jgi:Na+-transporting NADH:ubiquinone oxidoreductase subunit NqrB
MFTARTRTAQRGKLPVFLAPSSTLLSLLGDSPGAVRSQSWLKVRSVNIGHGMLEFIVKSLGANCGLKFYNVKVLCGTVGKETNRI